MTVSGQIDTYLNCQIAIGTYSNRDPVISASVLKNIVIHVIKYLDKYKKSKLHRRQLHSVQKRPVIDNLEALQCKQCQRWQYHMQDW